MSLLVLVLVLANTGKGTAGIPDHVNHIKSSKTHKPLSTVSDCSANEVCVTFCMHMWKPHMPLPSKDGVDFGIRSLDSRAKFVKQL